MTMPSPGSPPALGPRHRSARDPRPWRHVGAAALVCLSGGAAANDLPFAQAGEANGWQHTELPGYAPATFKVDPDGTLRVASQGGTSIYFREVADLAEGRTRLTWEWRVDQATPITDITQADGDDRDLAVHIWFPPKDGAGLFNLLGGAIRELLGVPRIGYTLTYVWGGDHPVGHRFINPHYPEDGWMIVLRQGGAAGPTWYRETVDIMGDFQVAFGHPPADPPRFIAISTDSDDTASASAGRLRGMRLDP